MSSKKQAKFDFSAVPQHRYEIWNDWEQTDEATVTIKCEKQDLSGEVFDVLVGSADFHQWLGDCDLHWYIDQAGYANAMADGGRYISLSAEIMGRIPGLVIDHKDRNTLDNRRHNLRHVTPTVNSFNSKLRKNNTSGYPGVKVEGKRFALQIKSVPRQMFDSFEFACAAARRIYIGLGVPEANLPDVQQRIAAAA